MGIFYRPDGAVLADVIPFYWAGDYHLFYLRDERRRDEPFGVPWHHLVTRDFVHFEDWGEALPRGTVEAQDRAVFTGCVVHDGGTFHIFYTGHNDALRQAGRPGEAILHATSHDLRHWTKDFGFALFAPTTQGYEPHDWRDPFVFRDERTGQWAMLLAARHAAGASRRRGCTALLTSPDLRQWTVQPPFWAPQTWFTHECPDLFRRGEWWYLVFSTFSERCVTHYRRSRSLAGPWECPPDDTFDGRAFYAAKTAGDGRRRYAFGWLPTRSEEQDHGAWQWGGHLVVHELHAVLPDGRLAVRPPNTVRDAFRLPQPTSPRAVQGEWTQGRRVATDATGRCTVLLLGALPAEARLEVEVAVNAGVAGVLLRCDDAGEVGYQVRLEPQRRRLVVDRWPRPGDQPFVVERPLFSGRRRRWRLQLFVSDTCLVVYVDDEVALSCRMYEHRTGGWGLFAQDGAATFGRVRLLTRAE